MMSPRSQARLPIVALQVDGRAVALESGWLTIVEQESGRRDWHAGAMYAEIHLERVRATSVQVLIGTPGGTLLGRAVVTGRDPFGITLAAAPDGKDVWVDSENA